MSKQSLLLIAALCGSATIAQPVEPVVVDVDCAAGDDLAQAIRDAEALAGRVGQAGACCLESDDEGDDAPGDWDGSFPVQRPIEVNVYGACELDLSITTDALTLRGASEDAAIVGTKFGCPGSTEECAVVEVSGAVGVLITDLAILQPERRLAVRVIDAEVQLQSCEIDTPAYTSLRADGSLVTVDKCSIVGGLAAFDSRLGVIFSSISSRVSFGMGQGLVRSQLGSWVRVVLSQLQGGALQGECLAMRDSRLELDSNEYTDVRVVVSEHSSLYVRGIDPIEEVRARNFSDLELNAEVRSVELGGFSRLITRSSDRPIERLVCYEAADAVCPDGNVLDSNCPSCAGTSAAGSVTPATQAFDPADSSAGDPTIRRSLGR